VKEKHEGTALEKWPPQKSIYSMRYKNFGKAPGYNYTSEKEDKKASAANTINQGSKKKMDTGLGRGMYVG